MIGNLGIDEKPSAMAEKVEDVTYPSETPQRSGTVDESTQAQALAMTTRTFLCIFFLGFGAIGPVAIGFNSVSGALMAIAEGAGGPTVTVEQYKWIISGFNIGCCTSFPLAGSLSDIFGRRWIILTGNVVCAIGGIVGAASGSLAGIIAAGTLFGVSTGLVLNAYAAIPELCPRRYRGLGLGWLEACITVPFSTCSVLLAQTIVHRAGWRWFFIFPVITSTVAFAGVATLYVPFAPKNGSKRERFINIDFVALALLLSGLTVFLIGISWAGQTTHPWDSASVIVPIVIGAVLFGSAFVYDFFIVEDDKALLPLSLFRQFREYTFALAAIFAAGLNYLPMASLTPQASTWIYTADPTRLGLIQLSSGLGATFGAIVGPAVLHRTKYPKGHIVVALFIQSLFTGLLSWTLPDHKGAWIAFLFFSLSTFSWLTISCIVNAGLHIDHARLGLATSLISTFRSLGGAFGNAILNTIYATDLESKLGPDIIGAAASVNFKVTSPKIIGELIEAASGAALGIPDSFAKIPGATPKVQQAVLYGFRQAQAAAFDRVFYVAAAFGAVALLVSLFIKDASSKMDNQVAVTVQSRHENSSAQVESKV